MLPLIEAYSSVSRLLSRELRVLTAHLSILGDVAGARWPVVTWGSFLASDHIELIVALVRCQGGM